MSVLRLPVVASAVLMWTLGCASTAHPGPAGDSVADADEEAASEAAALAAAATAQSCVPFSRRSCHNYYTTADGHLHCPESVEICHADGRSYGACGDLSIVPDDAGPSE
jgi:hypothetical protein